MGWYFDSGSLKVVLMTAADKAHRHRAACIIQSYFFDRYDARVWAAQVIQNRWYDRDDERWIRERVRRRFKAVGIASASRWAEERRDRMQGADGILYCASGANALPKSTLRSLLPGHANAAMLRLSQGGGGGIRGAGNPAPARTNGPSSATPSLGSLGRRATNSGSDSDDDDGSHANWLRWFRENSVVGNMHEYTEDEIKARMPADTTAASARDERIMQRVLGAASAAAGGSVRGVGA